MKRLELKTDNPNFCLLSQSFIEFAELFHKEKDVWIEARITLPIEGKKHKRKVIIIRINEDEK